MLTTSTYIAIITLLIALLVAVFLYFKRAMREIKNTQQKQERTQQVIDHMQGLITDVRATVGGVIRQATGHDEDIKQLKNDFAEAAQKIDAANEELAKCKEEIALFQDEVSKLRSTHKPSNKKASPSILERDLFAENSPKNDQALPSTESSDSHTTTETVVPAEPVSEPAEPAAETSERVVTSAMDLEAAKEDPVLYANKIAAQHPAFLANLNSKGANLTKRDRALSTFIALDVERETLQDIFGLTRESLKAARYRIRTKLKLERRDSLDDHLKNWL